MSVALRLMRFGKKGYPTYRIVALDKRSKRDGYYIEKVGLYNPMAADKQLVVDEERFAYWISKGAQASEGIQKLFKGKLPKVVKKVSKRTLNHIQKAKLAAPKAEEAAAPAEAPVETAAIDAPATETQPEAPAEAPVETPTESETPATEKSPQEAQAEEAKA